MSYQERKLKTWTIEETRSVLLKIKKKVMQLEPKIIVESGWSNNKNLNCNFDIVTREVGSMGNTKRRKIFKDSDVQFTKQSSVAPDGYSTTHESIDVVPIRGDNGFLSIKLSIGHSRSDYRKDSVTRKLEKRITPTNVDRLDEIIKELVTELQRRFKIVNKNHLDNVKEQQCRNKLSKTFPYVAEKQGFGRKETKNHPYGDGYGEGNYLSIKKDFDGTEIELQQRPDGDFNLRLTKLDSKKVKEIMERLK